MDIDIKIEVYLCLKTKNNVICKQLINAGHNNDNNIIITIIIFFCVSDVNSYKRVS